METKRGAWVANLSWKEVENRISTGAAGILPVGAASKEHGLHLPMNTDQIQAEWFAGQLAGAENILIWPAVTYGYYPAFTEYAGSCTLDSATFTKMIREILESILHSGIRQVLVINTGISTIPPLEQAINSPACKSRVSLFNAYSGRQFIRVQNKIQQQKNGGHADEIETSIMLAIAPEHVDMDLAGTCITKSSRGVLTHRQPDSPRYSASGVVGDAVVATAEKGKQLCDAILLDLVNTYLHL